MAETALIDGVMIMYGYAMEREPYMFGVRHDIAAHNSLDLGTIVVEVKVRREGMTFAGLWKENKNGGGGAAGGGGVSSARRMGDNALDACQRQAGEQGHTGGQATCLPAEAYEEVHGCPAPPIVWDRHRSEMGADGGDCYGTSSDSSNPS